MTRQPPLEQEAPRCFARYRLQRAVDLMVEHRSEHVVVTGRNGRVLGLLTAQHALTVSHLLGRERAAELSVVNALRLALSRGGSGVRPRPVPPEEEAPFPLVHPREQAPPEEQPLPLTVLRPSTTTDRAPPTTEGESVDPLMQAFLELEQLPWVQTPVEGLRFGTELLLRLVPSEAAVGYVYDVDHDLLWATSRCGETLAMHDGDALPGGHGLIALALRYVSPPLRVAGVRGHRCFDARVDVVGPEPRTAMYMPLEHDGTLLGLLHLVNRRDAPTFTEDDGSVAAYVGQRLAEFLYSATLALFAARSRDA